VADVSVKRFKFLSVRKRIINEKRKGITAIPPTTKVVGSLAVFSWKIHI